MKKIIVSFFLLFSLLAGAQVQDSAMRPPDGGNPEPGTTGITKVYEAPTIWQNPELLSSWAILFVGALVLLVVIFAKPMQRLSNELHVRLIIIVLTIVAALYLIAAGLNSQQTAPAFGLLGAIIGYILGKGQNQANDSVTPPGG